MPLGSVTPAASPPRRARSNRRRRRERLRPSGHRDPRAQLRRLLDLRGQSRPSFRRGRPGAAKVGVVDRCLRLAAQRHARACEGGDEGDQVRALDDVEREMRALPGPQHLGRPGEGARRREQHVLHPGRGRASQERAHVARVCRSSRARQKRASAGTGRPRGVGTTASTPAGDSTPLTASNRASGSSIAPRPSPAPGACPRRDRARATAREELRQRVPRVQAGLHQVRSSITESPRFLRSAAEEASFARPEGGLSREATVFMAGRAGPAARAPRARGRSCAGGSRRGRAARSAARCSAVG